MKKKHIIGFYNVENLFDIVDDPDTIDEAFTPNSPKKWTKERYHNKLHKLAKAIIALGNINTEQPPVLLGLAEIENRQVLDDLLQKTALQDFQYEAVHFDSPDERGIDVALLYRKPFFMVIHQEAHNVYLEDEKGIQDTTRDILHVSGLLEGESLDLIVTHWPSKRNHDINAPKRLKVATKVRSIVNNYFDQNPGGNIIVMGDFNDNPDGKSLQRLKIEENPSKLESKELYNPMIALDKQGKGSLAHKSKWSLFDQILVSKALVKGKRRIQFKKAAIFDAHMLQEWEGNYKGEPFRTYVGKKYLGGYSDHFPVYIIIEKW